MEDLFLSTLAVMPRCNFRFYLAVTLPFFVVRWFWSSRARGDC